MNPNSNKMTQNQPDQFRNELNPHSPLVLATSPKITNSALHNNINNTTRNSPMSTTLGSPARRQASAPLLASSNLDNDTFRNIDGLVPERYINFKKPQNEIFKELDHKIHSIVEAHSSFNKLYALNDFPGLGGGSKRSFELPPQLPPPPPWIPKVSSDYDNQWNATELAGLSGVSRTSPATHPMDMRPTSSMPNFKKSIRTPLHGSPKPSKPCSLTIDSAISRLHQRRQQQQQQTQLQSHQRLPMRPQISKPQLVQVKSNNQRYEGTKQTLAAGSSTVPQTISSAQFSILAKQIKDVFDWTNSSTETSSKDVFTDEEKKRFQENLITLLKREISSVAKSAKLKFNTPPRSDNVGRGPEHRSLLKVSPTTLYNTIHKETSLLLNKKDHQSNRSSLTLLNNQQNLIRSSPSECHNVGYKPMINKFQHTIKVIVAPTEYYSRLESEKASLEDNKGTKHGASKNTVKPFKPELSYQVIKRKLLMFQDRNQLFLGKARKSVATPSDLGVLAKRPRSSPKSIDKIVDRLQARCSPTDPNVAMRSPQKGLSFHQKLINSSAGLLRSAGLTPIQSPSTPIPVFRTPLTINPKGSVANLSGVSKIPNVKSSRSKRQRTYGLKLGNYSDRDNVHLVQEKISVDQFAKCLNLVRPNDPSLQRHKQRLLYSESRLKSLPQTNRPMRLRRLRGEKIHMPASASYRASRNAGLQ